MGGARAFVTIILGYNYKCVKAWNVWLALAVDSYRRVPRCRLSCTLSLSYLILSHSVVGLVG